ncbi:hypothetical protein OG936_40095 (plasmid) [Streptomyces sp. NBC_00846]|nr:hypothetical protein OG936_40095 [Streptomyces sp. NBC_00846]
MRGAAAKRHLDSGLLVHTEGDTAVLAADVQYCLRLLDSNETTTY